MNREIKIRAKRKRDGVWVYGEEFWKFKKQ